MLNNKKILFAAGGTGGHINPALAVAGHIQQNAPKAQILFVGTAEKMEAQLVPAAGFAFKSIDISGFRRDISFESLKRNLSTLGKLVKSSRQAKKILQDFGPDVVVGMGGYVSGPVLRMAQKLGIPTAIHEQNAYPGVANKAVAKNADCVMLSIAAAAQGLPTKGTVVLTGLPVRGELAGADRAQSRLALGLDERPMILSMGGSLGARSVNEAVVQLILSKYKAADCYFMHATGSDGTWVTGLLQQQGVALEKEKHVIIREYINDMERCLGAADLVVCRAGASSLSEIQALGKPSILIPSPNVAENHQYHNAMALVKNDAAVMIEEKDLTGERLTQEVDKLLSDPSRMAQIGANAKKMAVPDSTQRIVACIETLADKKK